MQVDPGVCIAFLSHVKMREENDVFPLFQGQVLI